MSDSRRLLNALLAAPPFIPELHEDDCVDPACVRCEPEAANPIERLDLPLGQVQDEALRNELCAVLRASQARHAALGNEQEVVADGDAIYMLHHPELCSTEADYPGWTPGGTR